MTRRKLGICTAALATAVALMVAPESANHRSVRARLALSAWPALARIRRRSMLGHREADGWPNAGAVQPHVVRQAAVARRDGHHDDHVRYRSVVPLGRNHKCGPAA